MEELPEAASLSLTIQEAAWRTVSSHEMDLTHQDLMQINWDLDAIAKPEANQL